MSDHRLVQCFGTLVRPGKPARPCRARYLWTAAGTRGNFGRKGTQCCPHCSTAPDFTHPVNRMLDGELSEAEYNELLKGYNPDGSKKVR